ncbi:MAG: hypothetical protein ACREJC_12970 [Tepidisphaeraceae bacterium]
MRNVVAQALPAGASMIIQIEPPMGDRERPLLVPFRGRGTVVVRVIDNARLEITNTTNEIAPFVIVVGKTPNIPPEVMRLGMTLIAALRNR